MAAGKRRKKMPLKTLDEFTVQNLQILDENGSLDQDLEPDLSDDDLKSSIKP